MLKFVWGKISLNSMRKKIVPIKLHLKKKNARIKSKLLKAKSSKGFVECDKFLKCFVEKIIEKEITDSKIPLKLKIFPTTNIPMQPHLKYLKCGMTWKKNSHGKMA